MTKKRNNPETIAIHGGDYRSDPTTNAVAVPIYRTTSYQFKKRNFYGGSTARAKQIEILGQLEYNFTNMKSTKSGKLEISGWIPVNENNPQAEMMAQRKITEELEFLLLEDLLQEYWLIEG